MLKSLAQRIPFLRRALGEASPGGVMATPETMTMSLLQGGDLELDDVPRYPPFAKGLPVAPLHQVLTTQAELIQRIRMTLGYRTDEFDELVLPVLCRYAEFVHLLPASEAHHHRGAGGLFRHGLEVAFWAAQASEATIFSLDGSPQERRDNDPRWRLAVCMGGLLHDVGKPLYDVAVTDRSGLVQWNPFETSLMEWAIGHGLDRYFLRWNENRHKRHEKFSLLAIERIFTPEVRRYLGKPGPKVFESLLDALAGTSAQHPVSRLIIKADQTSVKRDLVNNRLSVDEHAYGIPVEKYVFDAIRRLVKSGGWRCNEIGAEVWVFAQGVFINWRAAAPRLVAMLAKDDIPGIPRDADTLADILLERGYAIYKPIPGNENPELSGHRYWEVEPALLQEGEISAKVRLLMLRMESPELVFTTEPPAPVNALIIGENDGTEVSLANQQSLAQQGELADVAEREAEQTESPNPETSVGSLLGQGGATDPFGFGPAADVMEPNQSPPQEASEPPAKSPEANRPKTIPRPSPIEGFDILSPQEPSPMATNVAAETLPSGTGTPEDTSTPVSPLDTLAALSQGVGFDLPFGNLSTDDDVKEGSGKNPPTVAPTASEPQSLTSKAMAPEAGAAQSADANKAPTPESAAPLISPSSAVLGVPSTQNLKEKGSEHVLGPSAMGKRTKRNPAATGKSSGLMVPSNPEPTRSKPKKKSKRKVSDSLRHDTFPATADIATHSQQSSGKATTGETEQTGPSQRDFATFLTNAVSSIVEGERTLGETLCLFGTELGVLYPDGLKPLGEPDDVVRELDQAGWVEAGTKGPIQERHGWSVLILKGDVASKAVLELQQVAKGRHANAVPLDDELIPPADPTQPITILADEPQAPVKRRKATNKTAGQPLPAEDPGTSVTLVEKLMTPAMADEEGLNDVLSSEATGDVDIAPPKATPEAALNALLAMIRKRRGRWLAGEVAEEGEFLVVSDSVLDALSGEYPELSRARLAFAISKTPGMHRKDSKIYVRKKEHG